MEIRKYTAADEAALFALLRWEGEEWEEYHGPAGRERYAQALIGSAAYVALLDGEICGFVRCREDFGFGLYVHDLLVKRECRGRGIGRMLMERALADFAGQAGYVMSDEDGYYERLGYRRIGSVFEAVPAREP